MPGPLLTSALPRLRDDRGFTLVELVVVMAAGMVVASALFTILDVTLRQTTRTLSRVDSTQRARNVLERIQNEMHSACVANRLSPILSTTKGPSSDTTVSFWSQYGNAVSPVPVKRQISFDSTAGKLTESTYAWQSGIAPSQWIPSGTALKTETLLTNVAQVPGTPVFRYYEHKDPPNPNPLPAPSPNGLSDADARKTAEVLISLVVKPTGGSHQNTNIAANTVTNSVGFRLTPIPNSGSAEQFLPCQ